MRPGRLAPRLLTSAFSMPPSPPTRPQALLVVTRMPVPSPVRLFSFVSLDITFRAYANPSSALISATAPPAAGATQAAGNNGGNNGNKGGNNAGNNAGNQAGNQGGNRNAGNAAGGNRNAGNQGNAAAGAGQAGQGQAGRGGNGRNQRRSQFFSRFLN